MRIISNVALTRFASIHPSAAGSLQAWRKTIEARDFANFAELKSVFNAADKVEMYYVFNIGGNKYRIIAAIHFNTQIMYIRHIFTHKEYDKWKP
jgi:mRNA interferase HigB